MGVSPNIPPIVPNTSAASSGDIAKNSRTRSFPFRFSFALSSGLNISSNLCTFLSANLLATCKTAYFLNPKGVHSLRFNCANLSSTLSAYPIFTYSGKDGFVSM